MKRTPKGASAPSKFISTIFNSKLPEGLKLKEYSWENEYRGTVAAFIESGFVKPEWLPGHPGNPKIRVSVVLAENEWRVQRAGECLPDGQYEKGFIYIRRSSKGRLIVSVYCSKKECEKREEPERLERAKKKAEEVRKKINDVINELPTSPETYLKRNNHTTRAFASGIRNNMINAYGYSGGFSFPDDLIAEFDSFMARFNQMLDCTSVTFDQEKRDKEIRVIEKKKLEEHGLTEEDLRS